MTKIYLLLATSLFCFNVLAQKTGSIKGSLYDSAAKKPVGAATITILQKKDSSLVSFTMTDNKGYFELTGLANGQYRLMITHVNYHNLNKAFAIEETSRNKDLGIIEINDLSKMLEEVVITAEAPPVTLIGDTIQYNAGSFKVQPNADVEQLLKKMPGIKVEKDGTVKAQGQEVKKVLVDGKEFFGNDPKIATKNLSADAVDKVQVYDRLSDAAQLTGFDDGNSEKTINLKLKKDKKKGLFGKATAGGGTNNRYEGRFNANSFKGARQFSAIGMVNNTNAEGFSFMDMLNFTGELSRMKQNGNGNININLSEANSPAAGFGGANNAAIKTIWGGGLNYNNIIGNKTDFTSNYFYNHYNPKSENQTERLYFLPDSSYYFNQNSLSDNVNNSQRLNVSVDIKLDSFNSLKISPSLGYQQTGNATNSNYQTLTQEKAMANKGFSNSYSGNNGFNFRNDLLFRRKFRQKGRTFSLSLQTSANNSKAKGSLESINEFFKQSNVLLRNDSINQHNTTNGSLLSYNARAVYTEPIFKKTLLELSLGRSYGSSNSDKKTYDHNKISGSYDKLNTLLTNNFDNSYGFTNAGVRLRMQQQKLSLAAGLNLQRADLEGKVITGLKDSLTGKTFYNMLPNARIQYNFSKFRNLSINYSAITNQPSMAQLQPVADNSNPLNITEGNPDLKQEYTHALLLNFVSVNPFKNRNLFAFFNIQQTQNKIVNYDTINNMGIKHSKPVNVNGVVNINGNINLGLPLHFFKGTFNFGNNMSYGKGRQFINGTENTIHTLSLGPDIRLDLNPFDKLDLSLTAAFNYYKTTYTLRNDLNTKYFSQVYGTDISWQLPKNFYFTTGFTYTINSQRAAGFNTHVPLWNSSFSRQFLRFNRGELKLTAFDLLNQNIGISRNASQNYIEDIRATTLKRFFLLSFTYSLNKNSISNNREGNGIKIIRN